MGLDMFAFKITKPTEDELKNIKTTKELSDKGFSYISKGHLYAEEPQLVKDLLPYTIEKTITNSYDGVDSFYIYKEEEIGYWRKDYDLKDLVHAQYPYEIENCGYYLITKEMWDNIRKYYKENNYSEEEINKIPNEDCFYHEWY